MLAHFDVTVAYAGAAMCAACVPAMYFGLIATTEFYNAGDWGAAIIAKLPPLIWFLIVGTIMLRESPRSIEPRSAASVQVSNISLIQR